MKMLRMKKMLWSKLFGKKGAVEKEDVNGSVGKLNVVQEYKEAFRTNSFTEICNQVQCRTVRTSLEGQQSSSSSWNVSLSEYLVEPKEVYLNSVFESSDAHQSFVDYFEVSLEASEICQSLLMDIHQVHDSYYPVGKVIKLISQKPSTTRWSENQFRDVRKRLAAFLLRKNPFATMTPEKFQDLHSSHEILLHELTSQCRKKRRRTKFERLIKRTVAYFAAGSGGAIAVGMLVVAIHSVIGVVAAPGLVALALMLFAMKKKKRSKRKLSKNQQCEDIGEILDVAARGVYILINDFDTMSRLVKRLNVEMDHRMFVADICVRKGKHEMLKKVMKEFEMHDSCFREQLDELEQQIYLCFLDINRSRRLVVQEMSNC